MKFRTVLKRWWFWVGTVLVVVVGSAVLFSGGEEVTYSTEVTERVTLVQTVDANGEVVSIDEVELSFNLSGTLDQIFVGIGDTVEVGTILAALDTSELVGDVQSAYQAVKIAQAHLDQQRAGATKEAVSISEAALASTQVSFSASEKDLEHLQILLDLVSDRYALDTESASESAQAASDNYDQIVEENAEMIADAYDDLLSAAWAAVIEVRAGLSESDQIIGARNGALNDDFELFLSSKDKEALEDAEGQFERAEDYLFEAEEEMLLVDYGDSADAIVTAAESVADAMTEVAKLLLNTRKVVEATLTGGTFVASDLTALMASVDAARAAVQVDQAALENAFQVVVDTLSNAEANLEDTEHALAAAELAEASAALFEDYQVELARQSVDAGDALRQMREADFAQAEARLAEVIADPRIVDLASYEAEVARSQAAYASATARYENAQMLAPIIGRVTEINAEIGEQVVAASPVITVQTTGDQFEIIADISESDITKIVLNDPVLLTFDAFGSDVEITGFVGKINPAEKLIENVVYYEVTVYLDAEGQSLGLRPGLSVDLVVQTDAREDVITLPQRAVLERDGITYVRVLVSGMVEEREVTTGLRGDLGRIEITSGLEAGEEVVIRELSE
ncbi:hypothetical protein CO174_00830 [Candidatus Uhrbacteria bacterium CG_4_9_14_3_um_filter_50_9]|uniref:Multidrug resistance protein MdtA-like C-terminal permuted SH3 domain-containing protein n=1 Tax=Candidatus Uhrbacteria bacterium CG_4_9_14_3_um_filter_50_9 TaxID=1975035 RepID=A0A2M7XE14_9BACT|nr:MAG: hypothetical protein CO174_00830 [Candidatus Uhrbacteria bacterium CG_4_9_14_3_um_filter_50_9]